MKMTIIMTAYVEAYRLFGMMLESDVNNFSEIAKSREKLVVIGKTFKDKPIHRVEGSKLYVGLDNTARSNKLILIKRGLNQMSAELDDKITLATKEANYGNIKSKDDKVISLATLKDAAVIKQLAISFVNLLRLTKLEHGSNGIAYLLDAKGINLPQWWIHTKMNNFSVKSLKHSLKLIKVSTTKGSQVESYRYLANGSGALFPINITAAYLIDAFKVSGKDGELRNGLITDYLDTYSKNIEEAFAYVDTPAKAKLYAKSYNYGVNFLDLRMHLTICALSGFGNPLSKTNFEFFRYHFWRFNHISLKRKLFK